MSDSSTCNCSDFCQCGLLDLGGDVVEGGGIVDPHDCPVISWLMLKIENFCKIETRSLNCDVRWQGEASVLDRLHVHVMFFPVRCFSDLRFGRVMVDFGQFRLRPIFFFEFGQFNFGQFRLRPISTSAKFDFGQFRLRPILFGLSDHLKCQSNCPKSNWPKSSILNCRPHDCPAISWSMLKMENFGKIECTHFIVTCVDRVKMRNLSNHNSFRSSCDQTEFKSSIHIVFTLTCLLVHYLCCFPSNLISVVFNQWCVNKSVRDCFVSRFSMRSCSQWYPDWRLNRQVNLDELFRHADV